MSIKKILGSVASLFGSTCLYTLIMLLLLCVGVSANVFAETRNIYVGDIISLEIESHKFSQDELKEKFQDFEIISLEMKSEGYLLSLRTFDPGERKILLGDKEIVISVASTLDNILMDDIFEGEANVVEAGFSFHWRILFCFAAGVFLLSAIFILSKLLLKRKAKKESPYQLFLKRTDSLLTEDDNYLVDLTFYFKEYIESTGNCRIIGKTSSEIVNELKELDILKAMIFDIEKWLTQCDMLKFAGVVTSSDELRHQHRQLLDIAEKIENIKVY